MVGGQPAATSVLYTIYKVIIIHVVIMSTVARGHDLQRELLCDVVCVVLVLWVYLLHAYCVQPCDRVLRRGRCAACVRRRRGSLPNKFNSYL